MDQRPLSDEAGSLDVQDQTSGTSENLVIRISQMLTSRRQGNQHPVEAEEEADRRVQEQRRDRKPIASLPD